VVIRNITTAIKKNALVKVISKKRQISGKRKINSMSNMTKRIAREKYRELK
jgi:hypothetical protein